MSVRAGDADQGGPGSVELLTTKLNPPQAVAGVRARQRLRNLINAGAGKRLTLVAAPAGYGKTTLVATWFRDAAVAGGAATAWLSLEASENDPVIFLRSIIGALRAAGSAAGERSDVVLNIAGADLDQAMAWLINDLASAAAPVVLVLDDYHLIREPRCHELMAVLLDRAPANLRVVIASRSDPPLPLGSLRAGGQLAEVREQDLRLTPAEVGEFICTGEGLDLADDEIAVLVARTEGWVAALRLAAAWLRGQDDRRDALRRFAGDHRHLVDYLTEQVLADLDPEIEAFLVRTSVLGRFCAELCQAVAGVPNAVELIERIARANLFVVALDDRRRWYRYHHLFAGLLQAELGRREPQLVPELHRRAYAWHRDRGTVIEAVEHAMLAGEHAACAQLIAASWAPLFRTGRSATLLRWITRIPEPEVAAFPQLAYIAGIAAAGSNAPESDVAAWLSIAETALEAGTAPAGPMPDGSASFILNVNVLRSAFVYRDIGDAASRAQQVVDAERPGGPWAIPGWSFLAFLRYLNGEPGAARVAADSVIGDRDGPARPHGYMLALATAALLDLEAGDADAAQRTALRALEYGDSMGIGRSVTAAAVRVALGRSLQARGRSDEALRELQAAARTLDGRAPRAAHVLSLIALAEAQYAAGNLVAAHRSADEAAALLEEFTDAGILAGMLHGLRERPLAERRRRRAAPGTDLTETELAVLRLLAGPHTRREIAAVLSVSPNTVKTHTSSIYRKLGAPSREGAVARAREQQLI